MHTFFKGLSFVLFGTLFTACASTTQQLIDKANNSSIVLKTDEGTTTFYVMPMDLKVGISPDSEYYWYQGGKVYVNKGGYSGRLLHGECLSFDREGHLIEKGPYDKGRKSGEWTEWHPNGEKKSVEFWKKGQLHGKLMEWDEVGALVRTQKYKSGLLHGESLEKKGMSWDTLYYKKGLLKEPDTKRLRKFWKRKDAGQKQDSLHVGE